MGYEDLLKINKKIKDLMEKLIHEFMRKINRWIGEAKLH